MRSWRRLRHFWLQEADARYQGFRYYEDSKTMHTISRLATLFEELATYRNELAQTYVVNGLPMNRPLFCMMRKIR